VTVVYSAGRPTMSDLLADRIPEVRVQVQLREIPAQFRAFDYQGDPAAREAFQIWLNQLWSEKDARITALLAQDRVAAS
ncbi:MAG: acyltransferase, partial [Xanthomonadales bacterium]|nr:acyltransferase [Xanthomonadales bacterium]